MHGEPNVPPLQEEEQYAGTVDYPTGVGYGEQQSPYPQGEETRPPC